MLNIRTALAVGESVFGAMVVGDVVVFVCELVVGASVEASVYLGFSTYFSKTQIVVSEFFATLCPL